MSRACSATNFLSRSRPAVRSCARLPRIRALVLRASNGGRQGQGSAPRFAIADSDCGSAPWREQIVAAAHTA